MQIGYFWMKITGITNQSTKRFVWEGEIRDGMLGKRVWISCIKGIRGMKEIACVVVGRILPH